MKTLHDVKTEHIARALKKCGGNKTEAARKLDISVRALRNYVASDIRLHAFRIPRSKYLKSSRG